MKGHKTRNIIHFVTVLMLAASMQTQAEAQVKVSRNIELNSDIHDFGDILLGSGPVSCSFSVKNVGKEPVAIYSVMNANLFIILILLYINIYCLKKLVLRCKGRDKKRNGSERFPK